MLSRDDLRAHVIQDWLDEDGRPVGEQASREHYAACRDEVRCPYPDARRGMPMNRGAMQQLRRCWPGILSTVRSLSRPDATVHEAWRVSVAVTIAPFLLPRPTPSLYSALYKSCIGFNQVLAFLLLGDDAVADAPLAAIARPDDFTEWLDREGWLVGEAQVCAGPMRLIAALYDALTGTGATGDGWAQIPGWAAATEQAMQWQSEALAELIGDRTGSPLRTSAAPWLVVAGLREEQRTGDVSRLLPAHRR